MDTIANLLSSLKNASMVSKESIEVPYSKISEEILKLCKVNGFIKAVKPFKHKDSVIKGLSIELSYLESGKAKISEAKRLSRPGRRIYRGFTEIKDERKGFGLIIVSTSRGLMPIAEAKKKHLGGELICEIY
jgi:small subunit ribosomal protein S8